MGQFFKFLLASCLGVILATLVLFGLGGLVIAKIASSAGKPANVRPNTVLRLTFDDLIPEKTNNLEINPFDLQNTTILGLHDILYTLETAKEDDNIKGILLEVDGLGTGLVTAGVLREAVEDFKESGKFIIAYSKYYSQGAYYLASTADKIYVNPMGIIDFRGFAAQIPFMKNMFDKVGIKWQVYYAGKFKSATEPYRRTEMSQESRKQLREYIDEIYTLFLQDISNSRSISIKQLKTIADGYLAADPEQALHYKLIDAIGYKDEALDDVKERLGLEEKEKIRTISLKEYNRAKAKKTNFSIKNKIAVVFAEGTIVDGKGENGSVGDTKYTKIISKLRKDDKIKAIVLRVNSGGGSAMSSENIWRELSLAKKAGKPIVVSMGDYAASGGYYIACLADTIVAEANTLTGSIGVFSMFPSAAVLLNDKIGISFDTVKTGKFSTGLTPFYDLTEAQGKILQNRTDAMYETFLKRVGDGRGMSRDEVHQIAQGRVWTGTKAKELGLVDKLGGLQDAIETAANMAEIDDYRIAEYPKVKDPLQELIQRFLIGEESTTAQLIKMQLGEEWYPYYKYIREIQSSKGAQARLPFIIPFR